jgi:PAS domain S-box-containing protein
MGNNKLEKNGRKESFHTTLENLLEGCQIIDFEYRYLYLNNAAAKQSKKTSEELLGHIMMEMYPGIETTPMFPVLRQCMQERIHRQMENEFIFEDGTKGWYHLSFEPVPEGILIMSTDITEIKKAEEKFRRIFENMQDVYFETSIEGTILEVSPSIEILSKGQYHRDELIGKSMYNFYSDPNERTALISKIMEQGKVSHFEITLNNKDGSQIPCSISSKICLDAQGHPEKIIGNMLDITDRKDTEEKLKNKIDELVIANKELAFQKAEKEKRVDELIIVNNVLDFQNKEREKRATELAIANEELAYQNKEKEKRATELINAKEHAEESDRLKSAFLTNMSHEIRTPMNGILGFTELLKEPNLTSDDQQDYIQIIQISGTRMLNTINNIVDVSKIESGLIQVDLKATNINEKMEFTYKFFKPEVEIKGLQLKFKNGLQSKEAIIKTDNEKVYGILTNLVRNAIKFTFDGSIEFGYEKKGEYLEFFVKDTGVGIPDNQKEIIFERFRQGSESHHRGYEGSGLGLSIAKSYVEMLGGEIWVESEEGKGSTFYFTIPCNSVMEERTEIENAVSEKHKEVEIKKLKILIVEDDEISYSLLTGMLQKISKEVLHAITGVEAVEACRNNPDLDLILMDIRMPKMDGNEATRQIRQFNKDVIIIAQTAYAFSGDKEISIEAGCNDYISKPINKTLLYEIIKRYVNK